MSEKQIPNLAYVHSAFVKCPRCSQFSTIEKFIINSGNDGRVMLTATCPYATCGDVIQVYVCGESSSNGGKIE